MFRPLSGGAHGGATFFRLGANAVPELKKAILSFRLRLRFGPFDCAQGREVGAARRDYCPG